MKRRLGRAALLRTALGVAASLYAVPSRAFDYPEHAGISAYALEAVLRKADKNGDLAKMLAELQREISGPRVCDEVVSVDRSCLSVADIPALSGDHAASPLLVYWRWFDTCAGAPGPPPSQSYDTFDLLGRLGHADVDPELVPQRFPDVRRFINFVHSPRFSLPHWPITVPWNPSRDDNSLQAIDGAYASLAIDGHSHFRPGTASFNYANAAARMPNENRPALDAFAWYADLHAGAVLYARASTLTLDAKEAASLAAASALLELSSLHYLEDCVSAGHMVALAEELDPSTLNVVHDYHCQNGTEVYVPPQLCEDGSPEGLDQACKRGTGPWRVLGDHQIAAWFRKDHSVTSAEADLTFYWVNQVVQMSLKELLRARDDRDLNGAAQAVIAHFRAMAADAPAVRSLVPHDTTASCNETRREDATALYRALGAWWESSDDAATRAATIVGLLDLIYFEAARALPITADEQVDGHEAKHIGIALFLESSGVYAQSARFSIDPEVVFGGEFAAPRNRYQGFQARLGVGVAGHANGDGGEAALVCARIAGREFLDGRAPWWFLEQELEGRFGSGVNAEEWQAGGLAGTGFIPFERIGSSVAFSVNGGTFYDRVSSRWIPTAMIGSSFGFY